MLSIIDSNDIADYAKRFTFKANDGTTHSLLEIIYPIGVYYWSNDSTSPDKLFGFGTWLQIKDRFVLAMGDKFNTINETGGSFQISADKLPTHIHNMKISSGGMNKHSTGYFGAYDGGVDGEVFKIKQAHVNDTTHSGHSVKFNIVEMNIEHSHTFDIDLKDDGKNFPNKDYVQPYITAYCWKRTA